MARLIDADVYAAEMRKKQDDCCAWKDSLDKGTELYARAEQSFVTFVEAALTLKNQPTIPAIPVEWLVDKMLNSPKELSLAAWRVLNAWRPRNEQEAKK